MADKKKGKAESPRNVQSFSRIYKIEGKNLAHTRRECPKCGPGTFMAQHADRVSCGKCGYTEFKKGA